jgi:hypothetical protein
MHAACRSLATEVTTARTVATSTRRTEHAKSWCDTDGRIALLRCHKHIQGYALRPSSQLSAASALELAGLSQSGERSRRGTSLELPALLAAGL